MSVPAPIVAMLEVLSPDGLREIERLLNARLHVELSRADEREDKLGLLISLQHTHGRLPERALYDETRPPGGTMSRTLVKIYGTWTKACRAAATEAEQRGIDIDKSYLKPLRPWANPSRTTRRPSDYSTEEIVRAVLACAGEIGRIPTSNAYYSWAADKRRRARANRSAPPPRIPTQRSVERHFNGWDGVTQALDRQDVNPWASGRP